MTIVFFGSDDFATVHLKGLIDSKHRVVACVTPPDKARGRGWKVSLSPVKQCAEDHGIPVLSPTNLKDRSFLQHLAEANAGLFVVIAYGRFLPGEVLAMPPRPVINVHSSLLPKYRGAAPINWAVINGEEETGISIMEVTEVMDAGGIIAREKIKIREEDTAETLRQKMMQIGPQLLLETIESMDKGTSALTAQDEGRVTFAPKMTKALGHIHWDKGAVEIFNLIRGLTPWPAAYTFYNGKMLKILEAAVVSVDFQMFSPGQVAAVSKEGFVVVTGKNGLLVKRVHLQASKPMDARSFVAGHKLEAGFKFE